MVSVINKTPHDSVIRKINRKIIKFRVVTVTPLHVGSHHTTLKLIIFLFKAQPKYFIPYSVRHGNSTNGCPFLNLVMNDMPCFLNIYRS